MKVLFYGLIDELRYPF